MDAAVEMFMSGTSMNEVAQKFPLLHQRTIRRRVLRVQRGEVDKRRGPRPLLEGEPEQKLVTWILDMQSKGSKVTKKDILARANEQYRALTGETGENKLKEGWLRRFKERHPVLSGRAPSSVKEGEESSSEDKFSLNEDDEESNNALVQGQQVMAIEAEEEREVQDVNASEDEEKTASSKRQKTEVTGCSTNTADQQRNEGTKTMKKLDAIMQSTKRLEEMQRQQLEMLQQLCASNSMLSSIAGRKRNSGNMD
ncbi:DNA binding protein [Phytophthora megakarya]|uniref:DNA binding protein n=1 Tax=Phytophthora megakarya TaxID=4795 RepID=A0A225VLQ6_9STRA|nr:DNA binding protein [Phytophthora megakarya]